MIELTKLAAYEDEAGNEIRYTGSHSGAVRIRIRGSKNIVSIAAGAKLGQLIIDIDCDNGRLDIGANSGAPALNANIRVGQDASVLIGDNVSSTSTCVISAVEGTTVSIGDDVMLSSHVQIRSDDSHPIFDVRTEARLNPSRSIAIGNHVWVGLDSAIFGGARIGDGSVIGYGSLVKRRIPNNCVAAGAPARVIKRDIAWERPHLSLAKPYYKPDAGTVKKSTKYWSMTVDESAPTPGAIAAVRSRLIRLARRLTK